MTRVATEKRSAAIKKAKVDDSITAYVCPHCHIGWKKKSDVPSECPLCGTVFTGVDSEGIIHITTRKRVMELKAQRKEEEKLVKAIEKEEEKKAKAKAKAKEKKAKEKAKKKKGVK